MRILWIILLATLAGPLDGARLKELASLEQTLVSLQRACASPGAISDCGILDGLNTELEKLSDAEPHNHVPGTHGAGNGD